MEHLSQLAPGQGRIIHKDSRSDLAGPGQPFYQHPAGFDVSQTPAEVCCPPRPLLTFVMRRTNVPSRRADPVCVLKVAA
jgi:hypothetical protein